MSRRCAEPSRPAHRRDPAPPRSRRQLGLHRPPEHRDRAGRGGRCAPRVGGRRSAERTELSERPAPAALPPGGRDRPPVGQSAARLVQGRGDVMSAGTLVPPGAGVLAQRNRTLAEYAPVFLKWLGFVRQRRENTVLSYGEDLKTFLRFCEQAGLSKPDEVTFRHLEFYLGWLQAERRLKATSANRHVHALRTFWKWMVREEITVRNPAVDVFLLP